MKRPATTWLIREALAFDGGLMTAMRLARRIDEPLRAVLIALDQLVRQGEVRRIGALYVSEESPLVGP